MLLVELCLLDCHLLIKRKSLALEPRLLLSCLLWLLLVVVMLIGALLNNGVVLNSLLAVRNLFIFCMRDARLLVWAFLLRPRDFGIRSIHQDIDIICNRQITRPSILNLVWTVSSFSFLRCSLRLRDGTCVDAFVSVDEVADKQRLWILHGMGRVVHDGFVLLLVWHQVVLGCRLRVKRVVIKRARLTWAELVRPIALALGHRLRLASSNLRLCRLLHLVAFQRQNWVVLASWVLPDRVKGLHLLEQAEARVVGLVGRLHQVALIQLALFSEVDGQLLKRLRHVGLLALVLLHHLQRLVNLHNLLLPAILIKFSGVANLTQKCLCLQ